MELVMLGTGTSMGVPQIGCTCATCSSDDPRDRRNRSGALLRSGDRSLLIDTPPELRHGLLAAGTRTVDAVLYTHQHADHVHGIDDLRSITAITRQPLPLYGSAEAMTQITRSFAYIFDSAVVPFEGTSKPRLDPTVIEPWVEHRIAGFPVLPIPFEHGRTTVFGYRIGGLGYLTDVKRVPGEAVERLRGVRILVLNALWWRQHPTHLSIPEAVEVAREIGADRTILTHLTHETSHRELLDRLPEGIEPGYDGMVIEVPSP